MGHVMGGYVRGVAIDAVAVGLLSWTGMWLLGVDFAFALGLITALGEFIPYVGPFAAAVPAVLIALLQSPMKAVWTLVVYAGIQQIEGHLLTPNIMRRETNIPQPLVIIALFAGGSVGGILGAIVSIPVAGACMVFVQRVIAPAIRERWSDDSPAAT
jgi:predicted PurR-regulated permease PerM